jgi:hypothetical protein
MGQITFADNDNLLNEDVNTINRNTETILDVSKGVDLEVNAEKTKYIFIHH